MGFIDNIKSAFAQAPAVPSVKYGTTKEWFLSDAGRKALDETKTTVELTDYTYHYLKSIIANKKLLEDEDLYRLAFVFADSIVNSNQSYAGKESLLNGNAHPFIAYFQKLKRSLSPKNLCYEMLFILFGVVDPFNSAEWIYDNSRSGYSDEEYHAFAEEKGMNFEELLQKDYIGKEDVRFIMCEIIWLVGKDEFLGIVG
jgi:hypothetical protein